MLKSARSIINRGGEYTATLTPSSGSITLAPELDTIRWEQVGKIITLGGVLSVDTVNSPVGTLSINIPVFPLLDTCQVQVSAQIVGGGDVAIYANSSTATLTYLTGGGFADLANKVQSGSEFYINFTYIVG